MDASDSPAPRPGEGRAHGGRPSSRPLRQVWNLVNLSTVLGLMGAVALRCPLTPAPHGLVQARDYPLAFPDGAAFTVGNVVFTRPGLRMTPELWRHESGHASQYALCLGLPFLPLYLLAVGWSLWRCGDTASANLFERGAGLALGGYRERAPIRAWHGRRLAPRRSGVHDDGPRGPGDALA
jgi:hypothetical protein